MAWPTLLAVALQLAAGGADAYYTDRNMSMGMRERNPLVAPFVQSRPARIAYFSASVGIKIALPRILRRHRHNKLARAVEVWGVVDSAQGAAYSAIHHK